MTSIPAIEVQKLSKAYAQSWWRRRCRQALQDVTLRVERGEIFGLLGPNGAGKTTFVKTLLGIVRPSAGGAQLLGHAAGSRLALKQVGYLPENLRVPPYHTANTALDFYGRLSGMSRRGTRQRRAELLAEVGLADRANESIRKYSKGMLQRLGLAQALLHDPDLLILDEPTDGLDPVGRSQVRATLVRLRQAGKTVFLNSHILQEVELVCDRVAILDQGQIRFVGPVTDVVSRASTHIELTLEVKGDPQWIRQALADRVLSGWDELANGLIRVHTRAGNQTEIDQLVDELRRGGCSIAALVPRRMTLEDAFLQLLQQPKVA
jgi:ABC-2 type transport system ATP-binding protein